MSVKYLRVHYKLFQRRVYKVLEVADHGDTLSKFVDVFLSTLIVLNVFHLIFESVEEYNKVYGHFFTFFETFSVYVFSLEYILRVWSIGHSTKYSFGLKDRLKFMSSPMAVIDLLAVAPAWLPSLGIDFRFFRATRLLRLIKLARYSKSMQTFWRVITQTKDQLIALTVACFFITILFSCLVFYAEHDAQPEVFSNIPVSMWWSIVTMTTVGYGDMAPVTLAGRMLAIPIFVGGIGLFAAFTGVIGTAFMEEHQNKKDEVNGES